MTFLSARITTVADQLEAELAVAKVPHRRASAQNSLVIVDAARVPARGVFGEPTDGDALDAMLRGLVDRKVLFWHGTPTPPDDRPDVYRFTHKSGVLVHVCAHVVGQTA